MDMRAELLATAQSQTTPMRHRMRAAQQALRALPADAPEEVWRPFRALFDEVVGREPRYAEALRADAASVSLWWDSRRRPVIAAVPVGTDAAGNGTGLGASLSRMRALMLDEEASLTRRLDACEICAEYDPQALPGSGAGLSPDEIQSLCYRFARGVADSNAGETHRFRALRLMVRIENVRQAAQKNSQQNEEKRELLRHLVNAERRRLLDATGRSPAPEGYTLNSADWYDWPEGWPGSWSWPPDDIGDLLDEARRRPAAQRDADIAAWHAKLRAIRATNRPDDWERWLDPEPIESDDAA